MKTATRNKSVSHLYVIDIDFTEDDYTELQERDLSKEWAKEATKKTIYCYKA